MHIIQLKAAGTPSEITIAIKIPNQLSCILFLLLHQKVLLNKGFCPFCPVDPRRSDYAPFQGSLSLPFYFTRFQSMHRVHKYSFLDRSIRRTFKYRPQNFYIITKREKNRKEHKQHWKEDIFFAFLQKKTAIRPSFPPHISPASSPPPPCPAQEPR